MGNIYTLTFHFEQSDEPTFVAIIQGTENFSRAETYDILTDLISSYIEYRGLDEEETISPELQREIIQKVLQAAVDDEVILGYEIEIALIINI